MFSRPGILQFSKFLAIHSASMCRANRKGALRLEFKPPLLPSVPGEAIPSIQAIPSRGLRPRHQCSEVEGLEMAEALVLAGRQLVLEQPRQLRRLVETDAVERTGPALKEENRKTGCRVINIDRVSSGKWAVW